jgi:RimJ/RimL family protein N-acetyltransferase
VFSYELQYDNSEILIRDSYLNDLADIQDLIKTLSVSSIIDTGTQDEIESLFYQNITHQSPNKTYSVVKDDIVVGFISLFGYQKTDASIFTGYFLDEKLRGYGIMFRFCKVIYNKSFKDYDLNTIKAIVTKKNRSSSNLLLKLGFKKVQEIHNGGKYLNLFHLNNLN